MKLDFLVVEFYNFVFILLFLRYKIKAVNTQNVIRTMKQVGCPEGTLSNGISCVECGTVGVRPNVKIVGGVEAVPHSWASEVLVVINYKGDYVLSNHNVTIKQQFKCGGTLISQKTVITAAHCRINAFVYVYNGVEYYLPVSLNKYFPTWESMYTVYAGVHNISFLKFDKDPPYGALKLSVKKIIKHPSFDPSTVLNDIQLLILTDLVDVTPTVRFACLPPKVIKFPQFGSSVFASGWGTLSEGGILPDVLYNVRLTVYNSSYCSTVEEYLPRNWDSQMCAGEIAGGKDTCQGDSGSGVYSFNSLSNRYILAGTTSGGEGCARVGKPGIYTRISYFLDWILENWETTNFTRIKTTSTITSTKRRVTTRKPRTRRRSTTTTRKQKKKG